MRSVPTGSREVFRRDIGTTRSADFGVYRPNAGENSAATGHHDRDMLKHNLLDPAGDVPHSIRVPLGSRDLLSLPNRLTLTEGQPYDG